jgi:hypothetical protein
MTSPLPKPPLHLVHTNAPVDADGVASLPENQPPATDPRPVAFTTPLMQPFGPVTDIDQPTLAVPTVVVQPEAHTQEPERPSLVSRGFRAAGFMIAAFPVNLLAFILIVVLFSVGVSTLVVWLGLVVLLVATKTVFGFAATNRALIRGALGVDIPAPKISYDGSGSFWQRYLRRLTHPQMWRNLA